MSAAALLDCESTASSPRHGHAVQRAALFIQQAVDGVERQHMRDTRAARRAFEIHLNSLPAVQLCAWASVLLTFFESPLWCIQPEQMEKVHMPCENDMYPSYPIRYLDPNWGILLEVLVTLPIASDNLLLAFSQGRVWWKGLSRDRLVLLVVYWCDVVHAFLTPASAFRIAPYLRIGFAILYSHATRNRFMLVVRTLPAMLTIFSFGLLFIAFFAWIGVIFFPEGTDEGRASFDGLGNAMWNLLILLTTANFPDIMMPAYDKHREYFLFFLAFIVMGVYFLVNLLTAVTFNVYQQSTADNIAHLRQKQAHCLSCAYNTLVADGRLTHGVIKELCGELNHYHDIDYITDDDADWLARCIDKDSDGEVSKDEFSELVEYLTHRIQSRPRRPPLERWYPWLSRAPAWCRLKAAVHHAWLDIAMDVFLVVVLAVSVAETWDCIIGAPERREVGSWNFTELTFSLIFVVEASLKITTMGWDGYWRVPKNTFDFTVTFMTMVVTVYEYVYVPDSYNNPQLVHAVAAFRAFRVLRLLIIVPGYRTIINTFLRILPDAFAIIKVLFCAMYLFSVLGTQIFGGVINTDPHSKYSARVAASDFGAAGYYANNFNDMPSAMVVLFELLVVNNWMVITDGFVAACATPWARVYFVSFYVFGVVICLNIVVAFTLDTFVTEYRLEEQRGVQGLQGELLGIQGELLEDDAEEDEAHRCLLGE